jgi:uncharacterized membrane protein YvbJ
MKSLEFCNHCGADLREGDRECRCCGAETYDANVVTLLKRTSTRRARRGRDEEPPEDTFLPF